MYLLSFDVRNKVLNRSHESHHCTLSAQAQLGKGKPYRSRKELNTPHVNRLQWLTASGRVTMNGSVQKNWPLYVMDRLSLWTGSGQCKLIGSHTQATVMDEWPLWQVLHRKI